MATKAKEGNLSKGAARTEYNRQVFNTAIPNVADKRKLQEGQRKQETYQAAIDSGASEEEALAAVKGSGEGSITPKLDRTAYDAARRQERLSAEAAAAPPVKQDLRVAQLIRKFKGQAPLAETPDQFTAQLETSKGYGEQSALLTPAGRSRATESAIAAGLSPTEAQAQIDQSVESLLKDSRDKARITKGLMESPTPEYGIGVFKPAGSAAVADKPYVFQVPPFTRTSKPLIIPDRTTEGEEQQKTSSSFPIAGAANVLGKAATAVVNVGSNVPKATEALAQASLPRLGSGATTAAQDSAAILNKARDVARANLALKEAGILSKLVGPASVVGKGLGTLGKVAGFANKAKEVYQTSKFFADKDYQDEAIKEMSDFGERGSKAFGSEGTAGDKLSYVGESLSKGPDLMKTLLSLGALQTQNRVAQNDAATAVKASDKAKVLFDARAKARRANISDEDFKALPVKERVALMQQIRKTVK